VKSLMCPLWVVVVILLGFSLSAETTFAAVNLVANPGFESGTTFVNWTWAGQGSHLIGNNSSLAHSGDRFAQLDTWYEHGWDSLSQSLATTPGATYELSFWLRHVNDVSHGASEFEVLWDGTLVLDLSFSSATPSYTEYTQAVIASSDSTTLEFHYLDPAVWFWLDDVSVEETAGPAVPEPSTLLLWSGLAAAGLIGDWRRRKRAV